MAPVMDAMPTGKHTSTQNKLPPVIAALIEAPSYFNSSVRSANNTSENVPVLTINGIAIRHTWAMALANETFWSTIFVFENDSGDDGSGASLCSGDVEIGCSPARPRILGPIRFRKQVRLCQTCRQERPMRRIDPCFPMTHVSQQSMARSERFRFRNQTHVQNWTSDQKTGSHPRSFRPAIRPGEHRWRRWARIQRCRRQASQTSTQR